MLDVEKVDIVDERTFKLMTKLPNAALPALFANPFLQIIAKGSTDTQDHGIGAGPFTLTNAEKGVGFDFEASPHYFKSGLPTFKKRASLLMRMKTCALPPSPLATSM